MLTTNEQTIIDILREAKPFERVEIIKDQSGKADAYFVHRSQKIVLNNQSVMNDFAKRN